MYVATSIPYVNGDPHLGHAMEFVMADVIARRARLNGDQVLFSTGSDEHGGKIADKAASLNMTPKAYVDQMSAKFASLGKELDITANRFIRTTDQAHEQRAQLIWNALKKDIYKGSYVGWYCTGDEAFFSEAEVKANNGICPNHNLPYEKIEEDNYFFKLSAYGPQIQAAIESDTFRIYPETRRNEVLQVIRDGLEDISVSRPKEKISWGIPVPNDSKQVMYVWFEALMNYITVLGYPEHEDFANFWPATMQIIGKDIIRFHAAIWPAMLLGLGLPLPKQLYVHGFINVDGQKMSKSLGNYVSPLDIIEKYGSDAFRYFFLRHIPSYGDGDFTWETFDASYNNELGNELGNAVQRTAAMVQKYLNGTVGDVTMAAHDRAPYDQALDVCHFDRALDEVWEQVRGLNQYIDEEKPWQIAKTADIDHLREVLAYQVGCLLEIADLLLPFLPKSAKRINDIFRASTITPPTETLFPRLEEAASTPVT